MKVQVKLSSRALILTPMAYGKFDYLVIKKVGSYVEVNWHELFVGFCVLWLDKCSWVG